MTDSDEDSSAQAVAIEAKYLEERDKRLVTGRSNIRDLRRDEVFARYRDDPFTPVADRAPVIEDIDVAIIGAGMAGLVAGAKLRDAGMKRIRLIDEAGGLGGTWYWNRYPGVMCDVESYIYMPLLEEVGYIPTRRYAFGNEIRHHFEAIAHKYDLATDALFHTRVEESAWDEDSRRWVVRTDRGDELKARYLVLAVGVLNLMKLPTIPGMETFQGRSFHTARWDYEYTGGNPEELPPVYGGTDAGRLSNLSDKTVAVIGAGASAIQCVPPLAESAQRLLVFQRTPSAIGVRNNRLTDAELRKSVRPGWQRERMLNFQSVLNGQSGAHDMVDDGWTHHFGPTHRAPDEPGLTIEEIVRWMNQLDFEVMEAHRSRVEETVHDPQTAETLKPWYRYVCKRPCFHDEYLPTFNMANVTLIDCPGGIDRISGRGVVVDGQEYEVDCVVYATGFEGEMTSLPRRAGHEVIGRNGETLADKWGSSAASLFGMMTAGFPNMFIMPAPGQQAVVTVNHTQITVVGAEHVGETVCALEGRGVKVFDVSAEAERDWCQKIVDSYVDSSGVMAACTPSRLNLEGNVSAMKPENGSYGGGLGDFFGFQDLIRTWREGLRNGESGGLELDDYSMRS